MIAKILNYALGLTSLAVLGYVVALIFMNIRLKKKVFIQETKEDLHDVKKDAYSEPLSDLVDESNKELPARIKKDRD